MTVDIYQVPITHQALLSEPDAHNFTESLQRFSGSDVIDISINIGKRSKLKAPSSDSALFGNPYLQFLKVIPGSVFVLAYFIVICPLY